MIGIQLREKILACDFLSQCFIGVLAAEEVRFKLRQAKSPSYCIVNTDKASEGGSHWYAIFKHSPSSFEVMDSLGTTQEEVTARLGKEGKPFDCQFNECPVQTEQSSQCGEFCYYFCFVRLANYEQSFEEVFSECFVYDLDRNELIVSQFWRTGILPDFDSEK
jgi:hypothetical protein